MCVFVEVILHALKKKIFIHSKHLFHIIFTTPKHYYIEFIQVNKLTTNTNKNLTETCVHTRATINDDR